MSRLSQRFKQLAEQSQSALIPFITAGDPHPDTTVSLMHVLVKAGASILELGIPFSDPMAEGPVIQAANERALGQAINLHAVLNYVSEFRTRDTTTPVVLMGYLNPIENKGYAEFAEIASEAGVDGIIIVDLPVEESTEVAKYLQAKQIDLIFLAAPTSTEARLAKICQVARGFIYYVSLKGVTGAGHLDVDGVKNKLQALKEQTNLPIVVGFGIKTAQDAAQIAKIAEGVVIGSELVAQLAARVADKQKVLDHAAAFITQVRQAMDKV